jgi:mono/diheme cytochrome c family protein
MLALLLSFSLAAPPSTRLLYEQKCLYCHSEEVAERVRLTEPQWRRLIEQMRQRAPVLITRGDVFTLSRYMVNGLKLVPVQKPVVTMAKPEGPELRADAGVPLPTPIDPLPEEPNADELALAEEGFALMQTRCSRCHTLGRVYGKLDTLERSLNVIERMSLKTGSGITEDDLRVLEAYLRSQFERPLQSAAEPGRAAVPR